jgi:hypothetical protein
MIPLILWYSHDQTEGDVARNQDELDAALDRLAALSGPEWPALATVSPLGERFGPVLYVGFHEEQGALMWGGDTEAEYTLGQGSPDGEPLLYMYMTSADEFPSNAEIPAGIIRRAVHEFAETGQRPTCVDWQKWDEVRLDTGSDWPQ